MGHPLRVTDGTSVVTLRGRGIAEIEGGQGGDDLLGFEGDGDDLADEAEDVLRVVFAVGVVDDAGAGVGGDAVLVDDPLEGGAVAEAILKGGERDATQGEEVVVPELGAVFRVEAHALDAKGDLSLRIFDLLELVLGLLLVVDVEIHEALAGGGRRRGSRVGRGCGGVRA